MKYFSFFVFLALVAPAPAARLTDDFSSARNRDAWFSIIGDWQVKDGTLAQVGYVPSRASWRNDHLIIRRIKLRSGRISVRVRQTQGTRFTILPKCREKERDVYVTFGMEGDRIRGHIKGAPEQTADLGSFPIEPNAWYTFAVEIGDGEMTAFVDGQKMGSMKGDVGPMDGYVGVQLEKHGAIDDFAVEGDFEVMPDARAVNGTPRLKALFSNWHGLPLHPAEAAALGGSFYVAVKNTGDGPARLDDVLVDGQTSDLTVQDDWIAFARLSPWLVQPGETGMVEVRVRGFPQSKIDAFLEAGGRGLEMPVEIRCRNAEPLNLEGTFWGADAQLQINVLTFSTDLKTVYAYVQNNTMAHGKSGNPLTISRVTFAGNDVTREAKIGTRSVSSDVVPIVIPVDEPLTRGRYYCVTVETEEGPSAGHALRVFEGKFVVQTRGHGPQDREDLWEDLADHGITHISNFRQVRGGLEKPPGIEFMGWMMAPRLPASLMVYLSRYGDADADAVRANHPMNEKFFVQETEYFFADEIDKQNVTPVEIFLRGFQEVEKYFRAEGGYPQRSVFNLTTPHTAPWPLTYPDMQGSGRGYFNCTTPRNENFGRFDKLPQSLYRLSRVPFFPHFRDAEIGALRDPETRTIKIGNSPAQRCLTPKEERRLYYGELLEGLKSVVHWGYWAQITESFYYLKEPCVRVGLGGFDENHMYDHKVKDADGNPLMYTAENKLVFMLRDTWDEIGRLNCEMRTMGEAIAQSDVSGYARVTKVEPATGIYGNPAASTAALLHGLDTIIIPVVNHNLDLGKSLRGDLGPLSNPDSPVSYEPVSARVELTLPPWLTQPKHIFRVTYKGIEELDVKPANGKIVFDLPRLEVSDMIVVTSSDEVLRSARSNNARLAAGVRRFEGKTKALREKLER